MATKINADRSSDPSDYEKIRMLNIERNEAFLQQIGVAAIKPIAAKHKNGKRKIINTTKEALSPVRRSSRISLIPQPSYLEVSTQSI